jgi:ABC-2 type transport system permease protein/oleandomycin transport system permease protein
MPKWLEAFAAGSPVTITVDAVRALMLHTASAADAARYSIEAIVWVIFLLLIFMPLAVFLYRRS